MHKVKFKEDIDSEKAEKASIIMKTIYIRIIGLLMVMPGLGLLYWTYYNKAFNVTMEQIIIFISGILLSTIILVLFFWGACLLIMGQKD